MFFIRMRSRVVAHVGERDAQIGHVRPLEPIVQRPGGVVQQPAVGAHLRDVLLIGRRIERDHQIEMRRARGIAVPVDADLVPRRQPLDVRGKHVLAGDGHAHPEDGLHDQAVRRCRAGAVGGRDLEREVVDAVHD
jgi:hypothetical protein